MIDPELWADFVQHRKDIKKPLTLTAEKRMLSRLSRFVEQGMNVDAMLERSIVNGWQDVWPEQKESRPQAHRIGINPEPVEIDREAAKAAVREAMGKLRVIR
jgi:hypothetical protein